MRGLQGSFTHGCLLMASVPCSALHLCPLHLGAHLELAGQSEVPLGAGSGGGWAASMRPEPTSPAWTSQAWTRWNRGPWVCVWGVRAPAGDLPPGREAASDQGLLPPHHAV